MLGQFLRLSGKASKIGFCIRGSLYLRLTPKIEIFVTDLLLSMR